MFIVDIFKIMCILSIEQNTCEVSGMIKTGSGGLSGEHIQLCAEGARRKPNLSGKRTENKQRCFVLLFYPAVRSGLPVSLLIIFKEI